MPNQELNELLDRYATLRDTIQGLEAEREELAKELKAAMEQGETPECSLYRAELRRSRSTEYPVDRFRDVFGDAATLEVAQIDRKKVDSLVKAGELDGAKVLDLAVVTERTPSLILMPKTQ